MSVCLVPCIVCGVLLDRVEDHGWDMQPSDGLCFTSPGAYGTNVFDPQDGSVIEILVCDECLLQQAKYQHIAWRQQAREVKCEGLSVGTEHLYRPNVIWDPDVKSEREDPINVGVEELGTEMGRVSWHPWRYPIMGEQS